MKSKFSILETLSLAIATLFSSRATTAKLVEENKRLSTLAEENAKTIENLQEQHASDSINDEELKTNAEEARAAADKAASERDALQAQLDDIDTKSEELRVAINENPDAPIVDEDFSVVKEKGVKLETANTGAPAGDGQ